MNHVVKTEIVKIFKAIQEKGRRLPIHLPEIVEQEIKNVTVAYLSHI